MLCKSKRCQERNFVDKHTKTLSLKILEKVSYNTLQSILGYLAMYLRILEKVT